MSTYAVSNQGPAEITLADVTTAAEGLRGAGDKLAALDEQILHELLRDVARTGKRPAEIGRLVLEKLRLELTPGDLRAAEAQIERVLARIPGGGA